MSGWCQLLVVACAFALSACATLSTAQRDRAAGIAVAARSQQIDCTAANACAQPSPLRDLAARAFAESSPGQPRHYALILDRGTDALLARINLIRSATTTIDLQTYIFVEDDSGRLVLDELLVAARRGVRVRVLMDQLAALEHIDTLAALAGAHANFEVRLYNPMLGRAQISYPQYVLAAACCWRKLNQRMHSKLLMIDGAVGIAGGRNYQNDYYDWDDQYNFRDRDVLVAGPTARDMSADFSGFWFDSSSVPLARLRDIGRKLLRDGVPALPPAQFEHPERAARMRRDAADTELVQARLVARALPVGAIDYVSDSPAKHDGDSEDHTDASHSLRGLIESAQHEVLLQTPYLVLSKPAQDMFRQLHERPDPPRVIVSTNSLAATDAFIAYALSYKYKRRYLRDFGFNIYEYKPFPLDAPVDIDATGAELAPEPDPAARPLLRLDEPRAGQELDDLGEVGLGHLRGARQLLRADDQMAHAEELAEPPGLRELARGIRLGVRRHQERPVAERVLRRPREERRVHAAREGDHDALQLPEQRQQPLVLGAAHGSSRIRSWNAA